MQKKLISCLSAAMLLTSVAVATADNAAGTVTLTPFVGGYTFDGEQHLKTRPAYGGRLGYNFTDAFGTELVGDYIRTDGTRVEADTNVYSYHLDLLYHFFPTNVAVPFVMAGIGGITLDGPTTDYTRLAYNFGLGMHYSITKNLRLRGEVRDVMYRWSEETRHNIEYGIGIDFVFGRSTARPVAEYPPAQ